MTTSTDTLKYSVTADNYDERSSGHAVTVILGSASLGGLLSNIKGSTGLAAPWSKERDYVLSTSQYVEGMWGSALYKAITKQAALGFRIEDTGDSERRIGRAQEMLLTANGSGWVSFLQKLFMDYLTTDNGAFIEIARSSTARGSRIMGLYHLDSLRCYRTQDPSRPVLYYSNKGYHELRDYQVVSLADMPSPRVEAYGAGSCAAGRAWETILKLTAIETYFREKVSGQRNLAIHIVNGLSPKQLQTALSNTEEEVKSRGYVIYRGSTIIPVLRDNDPSVITIPLAEVPDGFEADTERGDGYLRYANALGVPVQDIQPLSGQGLGTGTQTLILDEAAEGMGLAAGRKKLEHILSHHTLPAATTFHFATNDLRDQKQKAEVSKIRAESRAARIASGEITVADARQIALDDGDLPPELFTSDDATPGGALTDSQKPVEEREEENPTYDTGTMRVSLREISEMTDEELDDLIHGSLGAADDLLDEVVENDDA